MTTTPSLAAIVCAYTEERWDDIVAAINSLQQQDEAIDEIILVIDHNEALLARAQQQFHTGITIVANEQRRGLSGARNTGIEHSTADILAFLDDDAEATTAWARLIRVAFEDRQVVGVGGTVNPQWLTARPAWWPTEFDWVVGCTYTGHTATRSEIRNPIGANMAVRRSAFNAVGGFSSGLGRVGKHPVGAEETELFIRINQQIPGSRVLFLPDASVIHKVPAARANFAYFRARCFAEGLSKAVVAKLVGSGDGLSSERSYTTKVLPLGVLHGVRDGFKGNRAGFGRAGAIVAGLLTTTVGYGRGRADKGKDLHVTPSASK